MGDSKGSRADIIQLLKCVRIFRFFWARPENKICCALKGVILYLKNSRGFSQFDNKQTKSEDARNEAMVNLRYCIHSYIYMTQRFSS